MHSLTRCWTYMYLLLSSFSSFCCFLFFTWNKATAPQHSLGIVILDLKELKSSTGLDARRSNKFCVYGIVSHLLKAPSITPKQGQMKLSSILIFRHSWNSFITYLCKCAGSADNSSALSNRTLTSAVMGDAWTPEQSFPILFRQDTADFLNADMGLLSVTRRDGITRKQSHIKIL